MSPDFGTPLVYVRISDTDPNQQQPAKEYAAVSLGNIQLPSDAVTSMQIDLNVHGMDSVIQTLWGVPKFRPGQQQSGWRYYTPQELINRGISGWPAEQE